jgi:hypothetical protein
MVRRNPFVYPDSMSWLPFMAASAPGTMIWLPLVNPKTKEKTFSFVMREESQIIQSLPKLKTGGVPLEWRFGLMPVDVSSGVSVPMVVVMVNGPGGVSEMTINAIYLDDETIELIRKPRLLLFVGDSGSVERTLLFLASSEMTELFELARRIYDDAPWTDPDFDEAKARYEQSTNLEAMWQAMGMK